VNRAHQKERKERKEGEGKRIEIFIGEHLILVVAGRLTSKKKEYRREYT